MAKVLGEALLDDKTQKYYYVIATDDGNILGKSDSIFMNQFDAETELVEILTKFSLSLK